MTPPHRLPLNIPGALLEQMTRHVNAHLPEEACGFLSGIGQTALRVLPVTNELHSPVRFRMAPLEQLAAMDDIETRDEEILAIFHSHPNGPPHPSPTDIAEAQYPVAQIILWRENGKWQHGIFWIENGTYSRT